SEPLGLGYGALRRRELAVGEDQVPSIFKVGQSSRFVPEQQGAQRVFVFRQPTLDTWVDPEDGRWSLGSLLVSPSSLVVPSPIALPMATSIATISRLDALPPTLVAHIDRDVMELYTRSGAVRDEIFSQ
ncbi:hypothetical protein Tco_0310764, partial [Tanacetum coccineum]